MPDAPIKPGMTESEIRAANLAIDVPFESGEPKPERLKYADLGADRKFTPSESDGAQQPEHGAGVHDGPLKGSTGAPATGDLISQDENSAQANSTGGVGPQPLADPNATGWDTQT